MDNIQQFKEQYKKFIPNFDEALIEMELNAEKELLTIFKQLLLNASIKTDRKSLPYNREITIKLPAESYINGMFEYRRIFRKIMTEILPNLFIKKIRFYVNAEVYANYPSNSIFRGGIELSFRYYI